MTELGRKALAEFCGSSFLLAVIVGSGASAERLAPGEPALVLLINAVCTGAGLVALIFAFGPISGAHFNPAVSLADSLLGGLNRRELAAYAGAQVSGAVLGTVVANLMFGLGWIEWATRLRGGTGLWIAEVVATGGLLLVIFGVARSGREGAAPLVVGSYITAAYFFTSSTSFANPAVTLGRTLTDSFSGISLTSVPAFVAFQLIGTVLAVGLIRLLFPKLDEVAGQVVVPHGESR